MGEGQSSRCYCVTYHTVYMGFAMGNIHKEISVFTFIILSSKETRKHCSANPRRCVK